MYFTHLILQLSDRVELSSHLCLVCLGDLNSAIKFRQRCIISEKQNLERIDSAIRDSPIQPEEQHEDIDDSEIELYFTKKDDATLHPDLPDSVQIRGEVGGEATKKEKPIGRRGPFVCGECGKSINNRSNFIEHKLRHTGIKNFHCQMG